MNLFHFIRVNKNKQDGTRFEPMTFVPDWNHLFTSQIIVNYIISSNKLSATHLRKMMFSFAEKKYLKTLLNWPTEQYFTERGKKHFKKVFVLCLKKMHLSEKSRNQIKEVEEIKEKKSYVWFFSSKKMFRIFSKLK